MWYQNIAPTMVKFIGEIEGLFLNATLIEYDYYIKKEQAKTEQAAIREQLCSVHSYSVKNKSAYATK